MYVILLMALLMQSLYHAIHMSVITQCGRSALLKAARWGRSGVVVELVMAGANVNLQSGVSHTFIIQLCGPQYALWLNSPSLTVCHIWNVRYMYRPSLLSLPTYLLHKLLVCLM